MENGEAKEVMCTTHGLELRWGNACGRGDARQRRDKGEKEWDNCPILINEIC